MVKFSVCFWHEISGAVKFTSIYKDKVSYKCQLVKHFYEKEQKNAFKAIYTAAIVWHLVISSFTFKQAKYIFQTTNSEECCT